jgi:aryl-alcohol dehydrogenase (NADP+)
MTYGNPEWRPWTLGEDEARPFFEKAFDLGINFFDTADMYSDGVSEEVTGKHLREMASRDDYVLATKVFFPVAEGPNRRGLSRKHILAACEASLRRLGADYIDLYQIHRWDPATPVEEVLDALDFLVRSGKVRYLGASSMAAWEFAKTLLIADRRGWHRFVSMQNHYNLVYREEEREMIPLCVDQGVGLNPWSPLARGFLTGTRSRQSKGDSRRSKDDPLADKLYFRENDYDVLDGLLEVSKARGIKPVLIALAWLYTVPGMVSPVIGATRVEHLEELVRATEIELSDEEIIKLEAPYKPHPILGHDQITPRDL